MTACRHGIEYPEARCWECNATGELDEAVVTSLATLQFHIGGLSDARPVDGYLVHLVRSTERGTPGPTLCGIDRFAKTTAGWSVSGGVTGPDIVHEPCPGCVTGRDQFPDLPITGLGSAVFV